MVGNEDVGQEIRRMLRNLTWATLVLYAVVIVIGTYFYLDATDRAQATTNALCALRSDLDQRIASSASFLKVHPKGAFGIPPSVIRAGIVNEQHTRNALRSLTCPPPPVVPSATAAP